MRTFRIWTRSVLTLALTVAAFGGGPVRAGTRAGDVVVVRHLLWDASQRPMYQQCATQFMQARPGIQIRVQQQGWDDYWSVLSTGFIANTAPDVFTNHLSKFPEHVDNGVLVDLAPLIARDKVSTTQYEPGLYENWSRDGQQLALPSDWDTTAMLVNLDMARRAGISDAQLASLTWNPKDGGTFGRVIAQLTQDDAGRNALDARFDKTRVKVYGYQSPGSGGMMGQTEWSHFAASNGFRFQDSPWSPQLHYDDPRLVETIAWLASLPAKGISGTPKTLGKMGLETLFKLQRVAMVPVGSWMTGLIARTVTFPHAWIPLPVGPTGQRVSMLAGLGHSIWSGSKHRKEAWEWVRYLGSAQCQRTVAEAGVVYPAIRGMADIAVQSQRRAGADARVFLDLARGPTIAPPIVANAAEVNDLMTNVLDGILFEQQPAAAGLQKANRRARELVKRGP